jgi:hypothetical protein
VHVFRYLLLAGLVLVVGACTGTAAIPQSADSDGDGVSRPDDCDDQDPASYPGAPEVPYDGVDQDCDGDDLVDVDGDGFDALGVDDGTDCDDADPGTHPGAAETPYDGIDQDCDGADLSDVDADGFASAADAGGDDCDDFDPAIHPDATEVPYDGVDQDCDGADLIDADGDGFDSAADAGGDDCDDQDPASYPGASEVPYDGVDQDCDGADLADVDGDGFDSTAAAGTDCDDLDSTIWPGAPETAYDGVDQDCDGADLADVDGDGFDSTAAAGTDCDDLDPTIWPGAPETPYDGVDQDCDGTDLTDVDGDGFDSAAHAGGTDCDDGDPASFPNAPETAYDGVDQDCSGADLTDVDGDGFDSTVVSGDDCDDSEPGVHPGAVEVAYDGIDQDCAGGDLADVDGDGYDSDIVGGGDCADGDPGIHPGVDEVVADGIDQDCSGTDQSLAQHLAEDHGIILPDIESMGTVLDAEGTAYLDSLIFVVFTDTSTTVEQEAAAAAVGGVIEGQLSDLGNWISLNSPASDWSSLVASIDLLILQPAVESAAPEGELTSTSASLDTVSVPWVGEPAYPPYLTADDQAVVADPLWPFDQTAFAAAWDAIEGHSLQSLPSLFPSVLNPTEPPVTIAVVDNGFDPNHPDIVGVTSLNGSPQVDLGNCSLLNLLPLVDDCSSDVSHHTGQDGHGTLVAGVAASSNDGTGINGFAPGVGVFPIKITGGLPSPFQARTWPSRVAAGILYAAQAGAPVINVSFAGGMPLAYPWTSTQAALEKAVTLGAVVVVSAGNDGESVSGVFPAGDPSVITVGATRRDPDDSLGEVRWFNTAGESSNYDGVDLAAPVRGATTADNGPAVAPTYTLFGGTSAAAPVVAGLAALSLQLEPGLDADEILDRLQMTAQNVEVTTPDGIEIWSRVNALNLVNESLYGSSPPDHPACFAPMDGAVSVTDAPALSWNAADGESLQTDLVSLVELRESSDDDPDELPATSPESHQLTGLDPGATYSWRVTVTDPQGSYRYSPWCTFTVATSGLLDDDGDGYCESATSCADGSLPGDCDDTTTSLAPDATEVCEDGIDQNCDGVDPWCGATVVVPDDFPTIQAGVNAVSAAGGGVVEVRAGTYYESAITVSTPDVRIYGDGAGVVTVRGNGGGWGVFSLLAGADRAEISGLTVVSTSGSIDAYAYVQAPDTRIEDCVFTGGSNSWGVYYEGTADGFVLYQSTIEGGHRGVMILGADGEVDRLWIEDQSDVAILINSGAQPLISNSFIVENERGIWVDDSEPDLLNNTIADNVNNGVDAVGGSYVHSTNDLYVNNSQSVSCASFNFVAVDHSFEDGNGHYCVLVGLFLSGSSALDSTYHLLSTSDAIDAGDNSGAPVQDFDGDYRPLDGDGDGVDSVDIGADEFTP